MLENRILRQHTAGKGYHLFGINLLKVDMQYLTKMLDMEHRVRIYNEYDPLINNQ